MKCKNCGKEISIYLPKQFCNKDCEEKHNKADEKDDVQKLKNIFGF